MRVPSGRLHHWLGVTSIVLALSGCASTGAATATGTQPPQPPIPSTATIAPTDMPTLTATSIATSIPALTVAPDRPAQTEPPTPENTLVPTATDYPAPAVPLSPMGPWLVFRDNGDFLQQARGYIGYLWALNQDGTGLTRLTNEPVYAFAVRPNSSVQGGLTIAYVSTHFVKTPNSYLGRSESAIKLLSWPSGIVKTIVYSNWIAELAWSPSGSKLAFAGAVDDYDIGWNAFVYDTATEKVTRITANDPYGNEYPSTYKLAWSSDERYVIHQRMVCFAMSYRCPPTAAWSARSDAGGVTLLSDRAQYPIYPDEIRYLGWSSPIEIILNVRGVGDNADEVRIANIETGDYTIIDKEPLWDVAYSPEYNMYLMTQWPSAPPNTLLIFYQYGERREVTGYGIKQVEWLSAYDMFLGQTPEGQSYVISLDGKLTEISSPDWRLKQPHPVIVSPDGQWWAWHHYHSTEYAADISASELWVGPAMAQSTVFLSFDSSDDNSTTDLIYSGDVIWSPDSQHLLWAARQGIFVASTPTFGAVRVADIFASFSDAVWVQQP